MPSEINLHCKLAKINPDWLHIGLEDARSVAISGAVRFNGFEKLLLVGFQGRVATERGIANEMVSRFDLEHVETILGPPDYRSNGVYLYNQDCLSAMRRLGSSFVDLTVTSPPYNIGKEYEEPQELERYVEWCQKWLVEIARLTSPTGAFWLNLGYVRKEGVARAIPLPYLLWDRMPLYLMQEIVWHYGAGVAARNSFSPRNEKFLWYVKNEAEYTFNLDAVRDPEVKYPNQKKNGKLKCNPLGKNPSDVWLFPKVTSGTDRSSPERTEHPAQFPVSVIERIIKACSNPGDIVLDPFMGSGTTALVAVQLDRPVLGFEASSRYLDIAARRLEALFEENRIAEAQGALFSRVDCP